jgi:hypothetical protein
MVCIGWREWMVEPMFRRRWTIVTQQDKADFVIETQRWRCANDPHLVLIEEITRFGRSFAWIYARRSHVAAFVIPAESQTAGRPPTIGTLVPR